MNERTTIYVQELMLFGGWAKALLPMRTSDGALPNSAFATPSWKIYAQTIADWQLGCPACEVSFAPGMDLAFGRMLEIWGCVSSGLARRAFYGSPKLIQSFVGKIGHANATKMLIKDGDVWRLRSGRRWTGRYYKVLPHEGIERARELAKTMAMEKQHRGASAMTTEGSFPVAIFGSTCLCFGVQTPREECEKP